MTTRFRTPQVILCSEDLPRAAAFYESLERQIDVDRLARFRCAERLGKTGIAPPHRWLGQLLIAWVADPDANPVQIVQQL